MSISEYSCSCGSTKYDLLYNATYRRGLETGYEFSLWKCVTCGLVRTYPVPGVSLYVEGYSHSTDASGEYSPQEKSSNAPLALYLKKLISEHKQIKTNAILDVGCNGGELVEHLLKLDCDAEGCDVDKVAVKYGVSKGLKLYCEDLSEKRLEKDYGAITLIHTLEHIVPIIDFLKNINSMIMPKGLLHVRVPNYGGWTPRLMKESWGFLMPSLHVWQFTPETLKMSVERNTDLKLIRSECNTTLEYRTSGIKGAVKNLSMSLASHLNQGDEIIATFQKD